MAKNNELYERLQSVEEAVFVKPLDSYETIISAVNHALEHSEAVGKIIKAMLKDMPAPPVDSSMDYYPHPIIYPYLIATYPKYCLFELKDKVYKASYTYNNKTREVELGAPAEVVVDVTVKNK